MPSGSPAMTLAPRSQLLTWSRKMVKSSRPVPTHLVRRSPLDRTGVQWFVADLGVQRAGSRVDTDDITVEDLGDRPAVCCFGTEMDGGGDLPGGTGHAPVRHQ